MGAPMDLPPIPVLETERLRLKPAQVSDAPSVQRRFPHWEVVKYMGPQIPWPYPGDGAEFFLTKASAENAAGGVYHWCLWLKDGEPGEAIGLISLRPNSDDQRGFWLSQEYWGQGLMTEAADRVLDFAFDDCGMDHITLTNAKVNVRSDRVKQRQGAVRMGEDTINTVSGPWPRQLWRMDADAWRAKRKS